MIHLCPKCNEVYETKDLLNYVHKQLHEQTIAERDGKIKELEKERDDLLDKVSQYRDILQGYSIEMQSELRRLI